MLTPASLCREETECSEASPKEMRLSVVLCLLLSPSAALSLKLPTTSRSHVQGNLPRRSVLLAAIGLTVSDVATAAESASTQPEQPEPAKVCDDECMDARVARKQALLKSQDRRGKADAKVLFGGDYQAGKRQASGPAGKIPVLGEFLLPTDVGGVNLGMSGGNKK